MGSLGWRDENHVVAADYHRAVSLYSFAALKFLSVLEHEVHMDVEPAQLASELPAALEANQNR